MTFKQHWREYSGVPYGSQPETLRGRTVALEAHIAHSSFGNGALMEATEPVRRVLQDSSKTRKTMCRFAADAVALAEYDLCK